MQLTDLLAPIAGHWLRRAQTDLDLLPHPEDLTRQVVPGPRTDRVLLLGGGPLVGLGVRSHGLALPGRLAARLTAATGRGVLVDASVHRGLRVGAVLPVARRSRLPTYDAIVLGIGATPPPG